MSQSDSTIIAPHTTIKGELHLDGPTSIGGRVEGSITANDALEIAADGLVEGDIHGVLIDILGTVNGNIFAAQACRLGASARVQGELRAANLAIAEGASFIGQVFVGPSATEGLLESSEAPVEAAPVAPTINRIEALTQQTEEIAEVAVSAQPIAAAPSGPTVRIHSQNIQNTLNRSPKIIKAR